jgi:hypothetical protein
MSKFKGELWAVAGIAVVTASTGIALADSPYGAPPQEQGTDPSQQGTDPSQQGTAPSQQGTAPSQQGTAPSQQGTAPSQQGTAPSQQGVYPSQQGVEPMPKKPKSKYDEDTGKYDQGTGMIVGERDLGFVLSLGGGVTDFLDKDMRDVTGVGGSWVLRATFGTNTPVGFEASYFGSAQSIEAPGLNGDAVLVSNGLQGAMRLNAMVGEEFSPFLFGGIAWARYDLTGEDFNKSAIESEDDVLEIPVGLGIGGNWSGFAFDLRGELRFATSENMVPESVTGGDHHHKSKKDKNDKYADADRWGITASIGYAF